MLNAFRHHCCHHMLANANNFHFCMCSTPFGITAVITEAFEPGLRPPPRAQRLSASLLSSHDRHRLTRSGHAVLNAFRHHCCHHAAAAACVLAGKSVLNAFRHHCCHHDAFRDHRFSEEVCSTPFGITAVITPIGGIQDLLLDGCSTPFGITAVITARGPAIPR